MDVYFSTVARTAPVEEGGELVHVDWDAGEPQASRPIYPRDPTVPDPNPRGNTRGGRGILLDDDRVIASSYHTLYILDRDLEPIRKVSNGLAVNIHETCWAGPERVWISSTKIDSVHLVDLADGTVLESYWPREMPAFQEAFGLEPLEIDKTADNRTRFNVRDRWDDASHLHLNAVGLHEGDLYALLNGFGAVVNLTQGTVPLRDDDLVGGHNLEIRDDGVAAINSTGEHEVRFYDLDDGAHLRTIPLEGIPWVDRYVRWYRVTNRARWILHDLGLGPVPPADPLFVRGLVWRGDEIFVGISPAAVLRLDAATGELIGSYVHSRDVKDCIHGLGVA